MFNFLKKNKSKKENLCKPTLTQEQRMDLSQMLWQLIEERKQIAATDQVKQAKVCEEIGLIQVELEMLDEAIESLEKSLTYKPSIEDGYKKLMLLYNQKRAQAAQEGNDEGIEHYMGKIDKMRQIAKKLTISRE